VIRIVVADLAELEAEALVRPVGADLEGVTPWSREVGVQAGEGALAVLRAMGELPAGAAVVTPGGDLPVDFLIHAVLASADEPTTRTGVLRALRNSLRRASEWEVGRLVLPPLGSGAAMGDAEALVTPTLEQIEEYLTHHPLPTEVVIVVRPGYEETIYRDARERLSDREGEV
jgi:O-acetyl-ADP-ribose deacetylase (regulator of RNase III)